MLQDLAGYIQRQVVRVHHTPNEAQIIGHQLFSIIHDEHAFNIQLDTIAFITIVEVKRRTLRQIKQGDITLSSFHLVVYPGQGIFKVMRNMFVKFFVLVIGYL